MLGYYLVLNYKRRDAAAAEALGMRLIEAGIKTFLDRRAELVGAAPIRQVNCTRCGYRTDYRL